MTERGLAQVETPFLLLSHPLLERNIALMAARFAGASVQLRPHVKTAKCFEAVRPALKDAAGVTVSTLAEAEYFFGHGVRDLLYAVGMAPAKLERARSLAAKGARLTVTIDSIDAAQAVAETGLGAVIEVDCDGKRAGVLPASPQALELAHILGASFRGVMTHAGGSYDCRSIDEIRLFAERERRAVTESAQMLAQEGMSSTIVSAGSTPTALFAESHEGLTEMRAGVYMFMDLVMANLGVCAASDIAISVASSVIGHQKDRRWLVVDAGWMALSRDRGTAGQAVDYGYGAVCAADGALIDDFIVVNASQEHGIVARRDGGPIDFDRFPVGTMLRILPNHACATAAQHSHYHVLDEIGAITEVWPRFSGW